MREVRNNSFTDLKQRNQNSSETTIFNNQRICLLFIIQMQSYKESNKKTVKIKRKHLKAEKKQRQILKETSNYGKLIQFMSPEQLLQFLEEEYYQIVKQSKQIELQINPIVINQVHNFIQQFKREASLKLYHLAVSRTAPNPINAQAMYQKFRTNYSFRIDLKRVKSDSTFLLEKLLLFKEQWNNEFGN